MKALIGLIVCLVVIYLISGAGKPSYDVDTSPEASQLRAEYINELQDKGVITRIAVPSKEPYVYVTPKWHNFVDVRGKEAFGGLILAEYISRGHDSSFVRFLDDRDGETIGIYTPELGYQAK